MKSNIIAVTCISFLVLFALAFISVFETRLASAQVDASSSLPLTTDTTIAPQVLEASTSTSQSAADSSSTPAVTPPARETSRTDEVIATSTESSTSTDEQPAVAPAGPTPPAGLTLVHIVGTKYTDYFTDGTTVTSYPGDPAIAGRRQAPGCTALLDVIKVAR